MSLQQQHLYNGLARPTSESTHELARTDISRPRTTCKHNVAKDVCTGWTTRRTRCRHNVPAASMHGAVLRPEHGIRQKIKRQKVKRQNSKGRQSNGRKIKRQKKQQAENSVGRKSKCRNYYCDYFILRKHLKHAENGQMLKASQPR